MPGVGAKRFLLVTIGLAIVGGFVASYRAYDIERQRRIASNGVVARAKQAEVMIESSRVLFREIKAKAVEEIRSVEDVRALMASAEMKDDAGLGADVGELLDHVSLFVFHRFVERSSAGYRAWRVGAGYQPRPRDEMMSLGMDYTYEAAVGRAMPAGMSVEDACDAIFDAAAGDPGGRASVLSLPAEDRGMFVHVRRCSINDFYTRPFDAMLGSDAWRGLSGGGAPAFWVRTPLIRDLMTTHEFVTVADVGLVCEFGEGIRRPMIMVFVFEPDSKRWRLEHLLLTNVRDRELFPLAF
ncbi:MAG: hypothetical protein IT434_11490 [Phycisphaerales bacterium]|jgi:hypothetical protein|nr:hypothetical protein [Phycisphaerales bacterium]